MIAAIQTAVLIEAVVDQACTKLFVAIVAMIAKYLFDLLAVNQYFAVAVLKNKAVVVEIEVATEIEDHALITKAVTIPKRF